MCGSLLQKAPFLQFECEIAVLLTHQFRRCIISIVHLEVLPIAIHIYANFIESYVRIVYYCIIDGLRCIKTAGAYISYLLLLSNRSKKNAKKNQNFKSYYPTVPSKPSECTLHRPHTSFTESQCLALGVLCCSLFSVRRKSGALCSQPKRNSPLRTTVLVFLLQHSSTSFAASSAHMRIKYEKDIILRNTIINHCQQMLCARNKNVYSINLMCVPLMIPKWNGEFYARISHTHTHTVVPTCVELEYAVAF